MFFWLAHLCIASLGKGGIFFGPTGNRKSANGAMPLQHTPFSKPFMPTGQPAAEQNSPLPPSTLFPSNFYPPLTKWLIGFAQLSNRPTF
jgi:hypothetical protein